MTKIFLTYFIGLLAIVDPPGAVPTWISLTEKYGNEKKSEVAKLTVTYVFIILILFLFLGNAILRYFHISLDGVRIAGGIMLCICALESLKGTSYSKVKSRSNEKVFENDHHSIAFTPMAMPLLSGPGAIAVMIGMGGDLGYVWKSPYDYSAAILAIFVICGLTYYTLIYSQYIKKLFGDSFLKGMTNFMGFFLLCLGVQFIVDSTVQVVRNLLINLPH